MTAEKLAAANAALVTFAPDTRLEIRTGHITVVWKKYPGPGELAKRWMTRGGQDFYPVWHDRWPHGGTASTALSQLVRWLQGKPVLDASSWRYWASDRCKLVKDVTMIDRLVAAGYPALATCVLCGRELLGGVDWWSLAGVTGPCCYFTEGCRQNPGEQQVKALAAAASKE